MGTIWGKTTSGWSKTWLQVRIEGPFAACELSGAGSGMKANALFLFPSIRGVGGVGTSPDAEREQPHDGVAQPLRGPARPRYDILPRNGSLAPAAPSIPARIFPLVLPSVLFPAKKMNQSCFPSGRRWSWLVLSFLLLFSS